MPELPDISRTSTALEPRVVGQRLEACVSASPFLLRSVDPPLAEAEGRRVAGSAGSGKRIVLAARGRALPRPPPDGRGPAPLESPGAKVGGRVGARGVRLSGRDAAPDRGEHEEARLASPRARGGGSRGVRSRRHRGPRRGPAALSRGADAREPHAQARADRPAALLGHRQRLLRRDPAPRAAVPGEAHAGG